MGRKKRKATGIQISGRFLRLVELGRAGERVSLLGLAEEELSRTFDPAELADPGVREEIAALLRRLGETGRIDYARPCLALDPRAFFLKRRPRLPGLGEKENRAHLLWEAGQFLGEEQVSDFSVDCALTRRRGFVVAVRRRMLEYYLDVCRSAGIEEVDLDVEPFALYNAAEQAGALGASGWELVADFSGDRGSLLALLVSDGELEAVNCIWQEEEPVLAERVEGWIRREIGGEALRRVRLAGAGHSSLGLELGRRLDADPEALDPFAGSGLPDSPESGVDPSGAAPAFAVAAGLAYRRLAE